MRSAAIIFPGAYRFVPPRAIPVAKASKPEAVAELERLAAKAEPAIAKAISDFLETSHATVDLEAIIAALKAGNTGFVLQLIADIAAQTSPSAVAAAMQDALWAAGAATAAGMAPNLTGVTFTFDRVAQPVLDWVKSYSFALIRQINDGTREAVRDAVMTGLQTGANPIETARQVRAAVGLTTRQHKAVANFRKHLETFHLKRNAAGWGLGKPIARRNGRQVFEPGPDGAPQDGIEERRLRDFRFDGQLRNAMETGKPLKPEQIDKMVEAYARKYRKYRSETIARTESLRATNAGVTAAWDQAVTGGKVDGALVRRLWITATDERLCEICAPIPGLNPKRGVELSKPFATPKGPIQQPPAHPNCRCTVFIRQWEPKQLAPSS